MARFRYRTVLTSLLVMLQLASLIIISYLLQENTTLKQTIVSISDTHQLKRTNTKSTLKENIFTNIPTKIHVKTTSNNLEKKKSIMTRSDIPSESQMKKTTKATNVSPTKLKSSSKNYNVSFTKKNSPPHKPRKFSPSMLTIVVFKPSINYSEANFNKTLESIGSLYPTAHQVLNFNNSESLNSMISSVKTDYFLILEEGVILSNRSYESIDMLWDALERYPEIDFIGGSYLAGDKLHVACHHYRLCRWTFSMSYEYKRSLDNVMICDGTSSSFMGRRASLDKINGFDSSIHNTLIVQDFFLRAKLSKNVSVGTMPNVMFRQNHFSSLYELWQSGDITKDIVPFAVKHKVFIFKDIEENIIDLCSESSPLSGKYLCDETQAHKLMLNGGHWAYTGIFAYPYILNNLEITLNEVTKFFEEHNVQYVVIGGVSLGAIKMRSILPWEAGDIDIHVYGMSLVQLADLVEPWANKNGYFAFTYMKKAVHIFCTPRHVGRVSGGLATVHPKSELPPDFVRIKTNGIWVRYDREFFKLFLKYYGKDYLQHELYRHKEIIECKIKDHNACLPNFKSLYQGKAGTLKEFYCQN